MTTTREYSDARLAYEREWGQLICHCRQPQPVTLALWSAEQCGQCGRKVIS